MFLKTKVEAYDYMEATIVYSGSTLYSILAYFLFKDSIEIVSSKLGIFRSKAESKNL